MSVNWLRWDSVESSLRYISGNRGTVGVAIGGTKLNQPYMDLHLQANGASTLDNLTNEQLSDLTKWYSRGHFEGHRHYVLDNVASRLRAQNPSGKRWLVLDAYNNGTYTSQHHRWARLAAHTERFYALGIQLFSVPSLTLSGDIDDTSTTITVNYPTSKPSVQTGVHPSGTGFDVWPFMATTATYGYSKSTDDYVSWFRIDDEIIQLSSTAGDIVANGTTSITLNNCVRGIFGTTATSHLSTSSILMPVYIGSDNASDLDSNLSGNPFRNQSGHPLRYAMVPDHDDSIQFIADQFEIEIGGMRVTGENSAASAPLDLTSYGAIQITAADTGTDRLTASSHGLTDGTPVMIGGADVPAGINTLTYYWVDSPTANDFRLRTAASGGAVVNITSSSIGDCLLAEMTFVRSDGVGTQDGLYFDVTGSEWAYNNADNRGHDTNNAAWATLMDKTAIGTLSRWDAQNAKVAPIKTEIESRGWTVDLTVHNNSAAQTTGNLRLDVVSETNYDFATAEFWMQDVASAPDKVDAQFQQWCHACQGIGGTTNNGNGYKLIAWWKSEQGLNQSPWNNDRDKYNRWSYGHVLLGIQDEPRNYAVLGRFWDSQPNEKPHIGGAEVFFWNFGSPTTPATPTGYGSFTGDQQPISGVYRRDFTDGVVIVNTTASQQVVSLGNTYKDCLTDAGDGVLTEKSSVTIDAYDAAFLVGPVTVSSSTPSAPQSVSSTDRNESAIVSFSAPLDDGGASIDNYRVMAGGQQLATGMSSPITVTGLTNGLSYDFTVEAHNVNGWGTASAVSACVIDARWTVGNVHLLKQTNENTVSNMTLQLRNSILPRVTSTNIIGFRVPRNGGPGSIAGSDARSLVDSNGDFDPTELEALHSMVDTLATETGRDLKITWRIIDGAYTPSSWISQMPAAGYYNPSGTRDIVLPCYNSAFSHDHDGLGTHSHAIGDTNDVYTNLVSNWLDSFLSWLDSRSGTKRTVMVHANYPGKNYSEYNWDAEERNHANYTAANSRTAHQDIMTIYHSRLVSRGWPTECAATGTGPMVGTWATNPSYNPDNASTDFDNPFIEKMVEHLYDLYGPSGSNRLDLVCFNMNGWDTWEIAGAMTDHATEYNKQYAARHYISGVPTGLQDRLPATGNDWHWIDAVTPRDNMSEWAYKDSLNNAANDYDTMPAYASDFPTVRALGESRNNINTRPYYLEVYWARVVGTTGPALYYNEVEPMTAEFRSQMENWLVNED